MNVSVREARLDDAESLLALARQTYADAFGHSLRTSDLAAHLDSELSAAQMGRMLREDTFLIAYTEVTSIGFVQFGDVDLDENLFTQPTKLRMSDQQIRRLYVREAYQNRGVGTQLMDAALDHPRLRKGTTVYLDVWEDNRGAGRLYARYGFIKVGEKPFYVASGEKTGVDHLSARLKA